jgi:hypothetical protein
MVEILSDNRGIQIIAEMIDADPTTSTRHVGAMEIHEGRHPQLGRITVVREGAKGETIVLPASRPTLTLAKQASKAA